MILDHSISGQLRQAAAEFADRFGKPATVAAVAPGRVNLIGEHVDYNDGWVLPMAIERYVVMTARPNGTNRIRWYSRQVDQTADFELCSDHRDGLAGLPQWARYPAGVLVEYRKLGWEIPGFDAVISSSVPVGSGLSSSAALEVSAATLIEQLTGGSIGLVEKALLCQRAEREHAGVPCGIMDQFSSVFGKVNHFMLIDCRDRSVVQVPFAHGEVSVLITNSHVQHALSDGAYQSRREQTAAALAHLGLASYRDVQLPDLEQLRPVDELLFRRARHVVTEIERTQQVAEWLPSAELQRVGEAMYASHESLRDDYEVSCDEIDLLVEIARSIGIEGGVWGSRITGGGFGGCTVSLVDSESLGRVTREIERRYLTNTGKQVSLFACRPANGAYGFYL